MDDDGDVRTEWDELIGHEEALRIALEQTNGTVVDFELDDDDNYIYEIEINAYTSEILEIEEDNNDDYREEYRRERGIGRFWNGTRGTFISFELLEDGIKNYTLHTNKTELLLFERIRIEDLIIEDTETQGSIFEIEGDEAKIRIFDVAPALMKIEVEADDTDKRTISFNLGDMDVVGLEGPNLVLTYNNYTAKLLSGSREDGPWNSPLDIEIDEEVVNYTFKKELFFVFRMTDFGENEREREREKEMEQNISNGISQGKIGGEVIVDSDSERVSDLTVSYADDDSNSEK